MHEVSHSWMTVVGGFDVRLLQLCVLRLSLLHDRDVGVVVPNFGGLRYSGSPTLRTNSASRGSERMGSSENSVFTLTSSNSRS